MKQVVILNNSLKMNKGKSARVCLMLGYMSSSMLNHVNKIGWILSGHKAVVLKSDNYDDVINHLIDKKIKFASHIDAGLTCVKSGSNCGCVFYINDKDEFIDNLKLY